VLQERKRPASGKVMALAWSTIIAHPTNVSLYEATSGSEQDTSDSEYRGHSIESHILNEVVQHVFQTLLRPTPDKSIQLYWLRMISKYTLQSYYYLQME